MVRENDTDGLLEHILTLTDFVVIKRNDLSADNDTPFSLTRIANGASITTDSYTVKDALISAWLDLVESE